MQFYLSFWRSTITSGTRQSQFYLSFWRSNLISCERVARDTLKSQFYLSFWRSNLISCEGLRGTPWNRNFSLVTAVFGDRTAFRAKGLCFVPSRWHCPWPRLQKRNRKEGEGKRARGQEGKRARGQEGKRARGEEEKRRRGEEEKM